MPIYEYTCRSCQACFERFKRPTRDADTEPVTCPECQSTDVERLISMFAINSTETQQAHLRQARKIGMKEHREKQHAEAETMRRMHEDHHDH